MLVVDLTDWSQRRCHCDDVVVTAVGTTHPTLLSDQQLNTAGGFRHRIDRNVKLDIFPRKGLKAVETVEGGAHRDSVFLCVPHLICTELDVLCCLSGCLT